MDETAVPVSPMYFESIATPSVEDAPPGVGIS
jgi:hypothetical protein